MMKQKYDIDYIKGMRLKGMTLEDIAKHYGVKKSTISKYLKRNNIIFWKLPKKCRYCKKVFIPKKPNHQYCSKSCFKYQRQESSARNMRKYYKRMGIHKNPYFDRYHPTIAYKDAIHFLNRKMENAVCENCGGKDFEVCRGEIVCKKCQVVQE